jgi:anti-sigma-K factor RskA
MATKEETLQVQQWIKHYPEVAAEFAAIESSLEALAQAYAIQPSEAVKDALFTKINAPHKQAPVIPLQANTKTILHSGTYWKFAAAAAILLLIGSITMNISLYGKYDAAKNDLQQSKRELADVQRSNSNMQQDMSLIKQDMNVVQSRYCEPVALHGMTVAPDAAAKIFWMKNTGEVYVDPSNLPELPEGKQFQLWAIVDGKPVDGGMIVTSGKGTKYHIQKMKTFGNAQAFAITIEKMGGSPAPTMDKMVVMGKM